MRGCYFIKIRQGFPDEMTFEAGPERSEGQLCEYLGNARPTEGRASTKQEARVLTVSSRKSQKVRVAGGL